MCYYVKRCLCPRLHTMLCQLAAKLFVDSAKFCVVAKMFMTLGQRPAAHARLTKPHFYERTSDSVSVWCFTVSLNRSNCLCKIKTIYFKLFSTRFRYPQYSQYPHTFDVILYSKFKHGVHEYYLYFQRIEKNIANIGTLPQLFSSRTVCHCSVNVRIAACLCV